MLPFEIRYLDVTWRDSETILKLDSSREALELEQTSSGWLVETTTFPGVNHYIGIRVNDNTIKHPPYFELTGDGRQELMPLKVPGTNDIWWIQNSGWDESGKRYLRELHVKSGRANLVIQGQKLTIQNDTFNFTVTELEYYLADFKNSLWMLILDNNSTTKASVNKEVPDFFTDEVLGLFHNFIQSAEKIKKNPGMILTESQGKLPLRAVRPVPRTFREYATQPNAKLLTSRTYLESFDTAENRFIHYCIKRVLFILKGLLRVSVAQIRMCAQKIEQENEWRDQLQHADTKQVDYRVYDNEITKLKDDLVKLNQNFLGLISVCNPDEGSLGKEELGTYSVELGEAYRKSSTSFFANKLDGIDFKAHYGTYLVVTFPLSSQLSSIQDSLRRSEVKISGRYIKSIKRNLSKQKYFELEFRKVTSVSVDNHPLKVELSRLIEHRKQLERNNWIAPLTNQERDDRDMENKVASRKIVFYEDMHQKISKFSSSLPVLHSRLVNVASFFKTNKVKVRSDCPNTMVFIQNPSYASVKSTFRKISKLNGLDEFMLNSLMAVDEIGLVDISNLYEKWCLLQIIKVLTQVYQFDIEDGWQRALIDAVLTNSYDIEFALKAPDRQQKIVLTYEKVLDSGKRPDFVIDLISMKYVQQGDESSQWEICGELHNRLVLDAKFRGAMGENQFHQLISELYNVKNYGEEGANQVFIIHPSPNVIDDRTSPLVWGGYCDYGQSNMINHRYGGIFVSPSLTYSRSLDHLQRLIGLFLQEKSQILHVKEITHWHNMSCISCGNPNHQNLSLKYSPTKAGSNRWIIECGSCSLLTIKTICSSCQESLFKNGPKWTYHRTRAEQMSNVVCPQCENFL